LNLGGRWSRFIGALDLFFTGNGALARLAGSNTCTLKPDRIVVATLTTNEGVPQPSAVQFGEWTFLFAFALHSFKSIFTKLDFVQH